MPSVVDSLRASGFSDAEINQIINSQGSAPAAPRTNPINPLMTLGADYLTSGSGASAAVPIGTALNGGTLMSDGSIAAMSPTGVSGAAGGGMFDLSGIGASGNAILPIAGAAGLYDLFKNHRGGIRGPLQGAASGAAIGSAIPGVGTLIGAGVGAGIGGLESLFGQHKTTRQLAQEHTEDLLKQNPNDPVYQNYVKGMRAQYDAPPPDPSHPFHHGQYATWQDYEKAGLDAADLTGVRGNLMLGADYTHLSPEQQRAVTQAEINAGNYISKKGEVEFKDMAKAKQIYDAEVAGGFKTPVASPREAPKLPGGPNDNLAKKVATQSPEEKELAASEKKSRFLSMAGNFTPTANQQNTVDYQSLLRNRYA